MSLSIVKHEDPLQNGEFGLRMLLISLLIHSSGFHRTEEALHHSVIIAIASATHAHLKLKLSQQRFRSLAGILAALIRVLSNSAVGLRRPKAFRRAASTMLSSRCAAMAQPTMNRV
jgi:hypothetical protein